MPFLSSWNGVFFLFLLLPFKNIIIRNTDKFISTFFSDIKIFKLQDVLLESYMNIYFVGFAVPCI